MEFFDTKEMPMVWMRTFVTLVPKKLNAAKPSHYYPSSLCSTLYKICAKLMVKRMKPILPSRELLLVAGALLTLC